MGSIDVLILSVNAGAGHERAAQAVAAALSRRGSTVKVADAFGCGPRWVFSTVIGSYLQMLLWVPGFYRFLYRTAEKPVAASLGKSLLTAYLYAFLGPGLRRLLRETAPKVIVCTHPFPLGVLCTLQRESWFRAKLAGVVTDFTVHPFWAFPGCSRYYLAAVPLLDELTALGEARGKGLVTAIPINAAFARAKQLTREEAEKRLGLNPVPNRVLLMGGSLGLGPVAGLVKRLLAGATMPLQLVVVAGKNRLLAERLQALAVSPDQLVVYGFTQAVPELMACADVFVSKPGGLSASEALALGLPQILFPPLPGHEEVNHRFLIKQQVAVTIDNLANVVDIVQGVLADPIRRAGLRRATEGLGNVNAAEEVAGDLVTLVRSVSG
ncbi:MAG: glycosyltransferase [Heliobacteriaceae bacterium]|nr:glycosyltransferase [Heliobacteriaceae bacterium]MDD4587249.1 glycosyltransferase [Heliobacteriaceae bacterium]